MSSPFRYSVHNDEYTPDTPYNYDSYAGFNESESVQGPGPQHERRDVYYDDVDELLNEIGRYMRSEFAHLFVASSGTEKRTADSSPSPPDRSRYSNHWDMPASSAHITLPGAGLYREHSPRGPPPPANAMEESHELKYERGRYVEYFHHARTDRSSGLRPLQHASNHGAPF